MSVQSLVYAMAGSIPHDMLASGMHHVECTFTPQDHVVCFFNYLVCLFTMFITKFGNYFTNNINIKIKKNPNVCHKINKDNNNNNNQHYNYSF